MSSLALAEVQQALLDAAMPVSTVEVCKLESQVLSPILTDYLDTLLQEVTVDKRDTIAEQKLSEFSCLHFVSARVDFLMPLSRIDRIDYAQRKRLRFALQIPDYDCSGRFMIEIRKKLGWLFFDELLGLVQVQTADVLWRPNAKRSPWFIGTHKTHLCRVFDPERMVSAEIN